MLAILTERAAETGETTGFSSQVECASHSRGTVEVLRSRWCFLHVRYKRLATKTGGGFSATELAGKPVMVGKKTGGSLSTA